MRSLQQSEAAIAADKGGRDGLAGGFADGRAREMHWHAQPVGAMCFSADGAYLYSAGREGVLVAWQLHSTERAFLPRLKAPILGMARASDRTRTLTVTVTVTLTPTLTLALTLTLSRRALPTAASSRCSASTTPSGWSTSPPTACCSPCRACAAPRAWRPTRGLAPW